MQTLGLSENTPRTESRLKSLFWPTIQTTYDVEYITTQAFWVCVLVGTVTMIVGCIAGHPAVVLDTIFFYLGACGVRRRSVAAALLLLLAYVAAGFVASLGGGPAFNVGRILFTALLLSNVRALWIARRLPVETIEPPAAPGLMDFLSDTLPRPAWRFGRFAFYPLAALELLGFVSLLLFRPEA
jgi:hypothetical protein